jgi:hypothetical protein
MSIEDWLEEKRREDMLNEKAIDILDEMKPETAEQKAALDMAKAALSEYKCMLLVADEESQKFKAFKTKNILHIYCQNDEEMQKVEELIRGMTDGQS